MRIISNHNFFDSCGTLTDSPSGDDHRRTTARARLHSECKQGASIQSSSASIIYIVTRCFVNAPDSKIRGNPGEGIAFAKFRLPTGSTAPCFLMTLSAGILLWRCLFCCPLLFPVDKTPSHILDALLGPRCRANARKLTSSPISKVCPSKCFWSSLEKSHTAIVQRQGYRE